jgi:tripartite-type tricarboxylate transporter receptor subunit TctC
MMALEQIVLWVNAESPHQAPKAVFDALKAGPDRAMKMGGTGSKQEDQIITVLLEKAAGKKMIYIPYRGGGEVAVQLVGNHVQATVNNPIEAESHWRAGKLRALCVMDSKKLPYTNKITATQSWGDLPTCTSAGIPVEYVMLRGIFMAPGVTPEQTKFYVDLLAKVRALPEWKDFMDKGAFNQTTMSGPAFFDWLGKNEQMHRTLMREAGFLAN